MTGVPARLLLARSAIAVVTAWNVQCALALIVAPALNVAAFELSGEMGAAAVRGIGVLFLMWNVPYVSALWHPVRRRISLYEALAMQAIGLLGESLILSSLGTDHPVARAAIGRFVLFDAAGLLLLVFAAWATRTDVAPAASARTHAASS